MRKAFLCHASKDKGYVEIVAQKLGRAKVVFDAMHFWPGDDFRDAIQRGLGDARVFVFIVSRYSLESVWCKYEVNEAAYRKLHESIDRCVAIIIDRDITFSDLPLWLQRSKAEIQTRPSQAARDIQHSLFTTSVTGETHPFIGRQTLVTDFARSIAQSDSMAPHVVVLSGLEGIGRRAYLQRVVYDHLDLNLGPFFIADDTTDLTDVYLWTLDETSEFGSRVELANETRMFRELTVEEQVREVVSRLKVMCVDRCLPCFVDQGGLLTDSGEYREDFAKMIDTFLENHQDGYLGFIHRRKPLTRSLSHSEMLLYQRLQPLEDHETRLLFSQLLRRRRTDVPSEKVARIAQFLDGYPPAVYFATTYISEYGLDALVADSRTLVDFKAKRFLRFLSELSFSHLDWQIAKYLAAEQTLPIEALSVAFAKSIEEIVTTLRNLIDHNLVVIVDDKYRIAGPIRDTIHRSKGYLSRDDYAEIRVNFTEAFWSENQLAPSVEVVDATLHAVAMSGSTDFDPYQDLVRVSTIHRLANESYYRRDWIAALEYATRAEALSPERRSARHTKFKALVQLERWDEATSVLNAIQASNDKLSFFLKGFMLRKQRNYSEACRAFQSAMDAGDESFPVYRDYAECLHRLGRNDEAFDKIKWVLARDSENIFVLDLMCRICLDSGRLVDAEDVLETLERCDVDKRFIHHRRASWYAAKRDFENAIQESTLACGSGYATFEAHAMKSGILIELGRFFDADKELAQIQERFGKTIRRDVQNGLRIKLLVRRRLWREAMSVWQELEDPFLSVHRILKARILRVKSGDEMLSLSERNDAQEEAASIEKEVQLENEYRDGVEDEVA